MIDTIKSFLQGAAIATTVVMALFLLLKFLMAIFAPEARGDDTVATREAFLGEQDRSLSGYKILGDYAYDHDAAANYEALDAFLRFSESASEAEEQDNTERDEDDDNKQTDACSLC